MGELGSIMERMTRSAAITHVILDYDGTCTDIPPTVEKFLGDYFEELNRRVFQGALVKAEWVDALETVRKASPDAGWTLRTTPCAPAAADPYILAGEAAQYLCREKNKREEIPREVFAVADEANRAQPRPELEAVLRAIEAKRAHVTFISNSGIAKIQPTIAKLFGGKLPDFIRIVEGGSKYSIAEPLLGDPDALGGAFLRLFRDLPGAIAVPGLARPVYLRRANYATAISKALGGDDALLPHTVFCGDIWEMDLAMPFHLGANVHLVTRAAPFDTYRYEREQIELAAHRGASSDDLGGLLQWF